MTVPQTAAPTLASFLLERLSEDEAVARACAEMFPPPWEIADRGWRVRIYSADVPDEGDHAEPGDMRTPCPMEVEPNRHHRLYGDTRWLSERVAHIARHDPARVLADIESKRRIVELHESWPVLVESPPEMEPTTGFDVHAMTMRMSKRIAWMTTTEYRARFGYEPPTTPVLRALAAPYSDHADYQESWR